MKTLVVEDDFSNRRLLQTFLSRYGECHVAVNGREAVEAFRLAQSEGQGYDLICMDLQLPEMNGLEAVHEIRRLQKATYWPPRESVRIIVTTASTDSAHVNQSVQEQCDAYLLKPIDVRRLLRELQIFKLIPI